MTDLALIALIKKHEGERNLPYEDTEGNLTIGVGHNLDEPLPSEVIELLLFHDIEKAQSELDRVIPWWRDLSNNRQHALISMMFNLGSPKFLTFVKMCQALLDNDFDRASDEMLDSKWADQVGVRAIELADLMRRG